MAEDTTGSRFYRKLLALVLLGLVVLGGILVFENRWTIHDNWQARRYEPTQESEEVRKNLSLSSKGDLVYRASRTEVDGKDRFRTVCPTERYEAASVLGCYSQRRIYVLDVDEPKLKGVEEVTAAHELLHAQFERMDEVEIGKLKFLLDSLEVGPEDDSTKKLIESYRAELGSGEELTNEMFAVYGTQLKVVGVELEEFYSEYFEDRGKIVEMYENYAGEFERIENAVESYDAQLAKLKSDKDSLEAELEGLSLELEREKAELDALANSDSRAEYQRAVDSYNAKVNSYNSKVEEVRSLVDRYNELVEVRNQEALSAKSLADELNANVRER